MLICRGLSNSLERCGGLLCSWTEGSHNDTTPTLLGTRHILVSCFVLDLQANLFALCLQVLRQRCLPIGSISRYLACDSSQDLWRIAGFMTHRIPTTCSLNHSMKQVHRVYKRHTKCLHIIYDESIMVILTTLLQFVLSFVKSLSCYRRHIASWNWPVVLVII